MYRAVTRRRHGAALLASAGIIAALAACGGDDSATGSGGGGEGATELSALFTTENAQVPAALNDLAAGECKAENDALPLAIEQTPGTNMQQKVQLLAGQDALPVFFAANNPFIVPGGALQEAGQVADFEEVLTDLGVIDQVTPAARSTLDKLFDGTFPSLPFQFNIEGIFYNKQIFADNGLEVPTTWDALLEAAQTLKDAGVTPFTASGKTGWTISRWIGAYLFRSIGPEAMDAIRAGDAKLTDPEYVEAAQAVADLGASGFFTEGITNLDFDTAQQQLLDGDVAMMYGLTSMLSKINDPELNNVGAENIGFLPFPEVEGGAGSIEQLPANVGSPTAMSSKLYDDAVGGWLTCIANNFASNVMENQGTFSGFKLSAPPENAPPLTAELQTLIDNTDETVLWFEALFPQKAVTDASNNAAPLVTGAMSADQYMQVLQADVDAG